MRLGGAVVYVRLEGVQWYAALHPLVLAGHIGPAQAAGHLDLDPLGAPLHGAGDGLLDGPAVGDATLDLVRYGAGHQGGIDLRDANLVDVDANPATGGPLQGGPQLVHPLTPAPDDDAGAGGVDGHGDLVGVALDLHR